jgi:putative transposase
MQSSYGEPGDNHHILIDISIFISLNMSMPRIARVVVANYPHHITQRGTNRANIFHDDEDREYFLQNLNEFASKTGTKIWAYCLMDNHFHLLLEPDRNQSLGKCLHGATFRYAQYFNQKYDRSGRLWQNRYFSCPVDKEEYLWAVVRYIENNPVRAKIVDKAESWEWSSAKAHIMGEQKETLILHEWLNETERPEYRSFIKDDGMNDEIRKATATGRPLGSMSFIEMLEKMTGRQLRPKKGGRPKKSR